MRIIHGGTILFLWIGIGCQSGPAPKLEAPVALIEAPSQVDKVLAIWTDSVLRQDDRPVAQGFAARVYLTGPDSETPVAVPGEFKFYAFRESQGTKAEGGAGIRPEKVWTFQADEAEQLLRQDPLGWGYNFWIPWGPPEKADRECTMLVRFTPKGGSPVVSDSTLVILPNLENSRFRTVARQVEESPDAPAGTIH